MVVVVQYFFKTEYMSSRLNSNFLTPILKSSNAKTLDNYCLIVMGNFLFKIIMKTIIDCLAKVASKILSPQQLVRQRL